MVSIIIRTKNEERWIESCLKSIYEQNYKDFEVILIDNQSTDKFIDEFRDTYLSRTNFLRGDYEKIVDKLPDNFLYLGFIFKFSATSKNSVQFSFSRLSDAFLNIDSFFSFVESSALTNLSG